MDERFEAMGGGCGILYVVATPIGNLEDITLRALRVLKEVDLILAENGGHTRKLCEHYGIKTKIVTYNQHSRKGRTEKHLVPLRLSGNETCIAPSPSGFRGSPTSAWIPEASSPCA